MERVREEDRTEESGWKGEGEKKWKLGGVCVVGFRGYRRPYEGYLSNCVYAPFNAIRQRPVDKCILQRFVVQRKNTLYYTYSVFIMYSYVHFTWHYRPVKTFPDCLKEGAYGGCYLTIV